MHTSIKLYRLNRLVVWQAAAEVGQASTPENVLSLSKPRAQIISTL